MRRFAAALVLAALWALPAAAQTAVPITTCGVPAKNYTLGGPRDLTQTLTGLLCDQTTLAPLQPTLTTTVSGTVTLNNTEPTLTTTMGCTATSTLPAVAATPGATVIPICDTMQRIIVALWSDRGAMVRGKALPSSTASTTIIAANATNKIYVTSIQCWNPGVTSTLATFNDTANTALFLPAGSGNNPQIATPLVGQAINSAFQMALSLSSSSVGCNAQGFLGG